MLLSSAVAAVYVTYSGPVLRKEKCPASVYLTLLSLIVIILSLIMARISGEQVVVFSRDPVHGLFGFATTSYVQSRAVGTTPCMDSSASA